MTKPSDAALDLEFLIRRKRPALLTGEAGIGKSDIVRQVTTKLDLRLIDERAVYMDPTDVKGLPHVNGDGRAHWAQPEFLPRDGKGAMFFDELNRAPQLVQNALLQLTLDRRIGEYCLPDGWVVIAAGNPDTSRGVQRMNEALASRFVHIPVETDATDWSAWGAAHGIRPEVIAYIQFRPAMLHAYDPKATEKAFPCPRTWHFVSDILDGRPADRREHALYAGTVGRGAADEFVGFLQMYRSLPSLDAIIRDPQNAAVPKATELSVTSAVTVGLAFKATKTNFAAIIAYAKRLPEEWAIGLVKIAAARDPALCNTPAFIQFAAANADMMG
jgi:hypothetical protein